MVSGKSDYQLIVVPICRVIVVSGKSGFKENHAGIKFFTKF